MLRGLVLFALFLVSGPILASPLRVAVASNFLLPLEALAEAYAEQGGAALRMSAGSTGQHYAQIINGAPFDIFLAADAARPARLAEQSLVLPNSRQTYAIGRLVLWTEPGAILPKDLSGLTAQMPRRLAIASPRLAPYGLAAQQALEATAQWQSLKPVVVEGKNVGQALQFLATGNASHALVAASFTVAEQRPAGQWMPVDPGLHDPIRQDAVILRNTAHAAEARAFLAFLKSPEAAEILRAFGYDMAEEG